MYLETYNKGRDSAKFERMDEVGSLYELTINHVYNQLTINYLTN